MPNIIRVPVAGAELIVESFGAGPTLIFAHGLTGNRQSTKRQFLSLAPQYRIVTYDQRGHGDSTPVTDPAGYDPVVMAADMGAVMDALGIARAIVGGESMGAATALIFALRHPERVAKLLLTAPAFGDRPNTEIGRFLDLADAIETYGMARFLEAAADTWRNDFHWPPDVVASVGATFRAHDERSLVAALRGVIGWTPLPDLGLLYNLNTPTCIITWNSDALHPADLTHRMVANLPDAHVVEFPPLPAIFQNPEAVGEAYARFLDVCATA